MSDEFDVSFTDSLTIAQRDNLVERLYKAWDDIGPEAQAKLKPTLDEAHRQLGLFLETGKPPSSSTHLILRLKSYLTEDWDGHLARLGQPMSKPAQRPLATPAVTKELEASLGSEGQILGTGKYQELDLRWELVAGTVWLEHLFYKHPFPSGAPPTLQMDDHVSIAIAGDFGTGNFGSGDSPSTKITQLIPGLKPDYTIHLGDVYYAGLNGEESNKLLSLWPQGSKGSLTLNSNHEMYPGGDPYFNEVLGSSTFRKLQSQYSYFALENDYWIIVGLDSAYFSSTLGLYMNGTLGKENEQTEFLRQLAKRGKKLIVLTHHNGIPIGGFNPKSDMPLQLYNDVMDAFSGAPAPAYWYFGHEHVAAAYMPIPGTETLCRCLGHGALPWGMASSLQIAQGQGKVAWFEHCNAGDPDDKLRVYNGFVFLELSGPNLTETFYDETGRKAWSPGSVDQRCP